VKIHPLLSDSPFSPSPRRTVPHLSFCVKFFTDLNVYMG
jgi:hypothetical protein